MIGPSVLLDTAVQEFCPFPAKQQGYFCHLMTTKLSARGQVDFSKTVKAYIFCMILSIPRTLFSFFLHICMYVLVDNSPISHLALTRSVQPVLMTQEGKKKKKCAIITRSWLERESKRWTSLGLAQPRLRIIGWHTLSYIKTYICKETRFKNENYYLGLTGRPIF